MFHPDQAIRFEVQAIFPRGSIGSVMFGNLGEGHPRLSSGEGASTSPINNGCSHPTESYRFYVTTQSGTLYDVTVANDVDRDTRADIIKRLYALSEQHPLELTPQYPQQYFSSLGQYYHYALTQLDGQYRQNALGIMASHYKDTELACQWAQSIEEALKTFSISSGQPIDPAREKLRDLWSNMTQHDDRYYDHYVLRVDSPTPEEKERLQHQEDLGAQYYHALLHFKGELLETALGFDSRHYQNEIALQDHVGWIDLLITEYCRQSKHPIDEACRNLRELIVTIVRKIRQTEEYVERSHSLVDNDLYRWGQHFYILLLDYFDRFIFPEEGESADQNAQRIARALWYYMQNSHDKDATPFFRLSDVWMKYVGTTDYNTFLERVMYPATNGREHYTAVSKLMNDAEGDRLDAYLDYYGKAITKYLDPSFEARRDIRKNQTPLTDYIKYQFHTNPSLVNMVVSGPGSWHTVAQLYREFEEEQTGGQGRGVTLWESCQDSVMVLLPLLEQVNPGIITYRYLFPALSPDMHEYDILSHVFSDAFSNKEHRPRRCEIFDFTLCRDSSLPTLHTALIDYTRRHTVLTIVVTVTPIPGADVVLHV